MRVFLSIVGTVTLLLSVTFLGDGFGAYFGSKYITHQSAGLQILTVGALFLLITCFCWKNALTKSDLTEEVTRLCKRLDTIEFNIKKKD